MEYTEESIGKHLVIVRGRLLEDLVPFLDHLQRAQTRKVPWSLIPSVERLAKAIIDDKKLIICCENSYNYGILWSENEVRTLHSYHVLILPQLHRTNVLLHTLIGHELFHLHCKDFTDKYNDAVAKNIASECWTQFRDMQPGPLFVDFHKKQMREISKIAHYTWLRAMQELLCDMACVELFGPAAILAMKAYSASLPLKRPPSHKNNFYPPWQYRFEVVWKHSTVQKDLPRLYEQCDKVKIQEITECFKKEMESFASVANSCEGEALVDRHPLAKIAYSEVKKLLPEAKKFVNKRIPPSLRRWNVKEVLEQIPILLTRLKNGIPPNEIPTIELTELGKLKKFMPTAAELPAILIAGWIYETYWQAVPDPKKNVLDYDTILRLLLKACEDAEALKAIRKSGN